MTDSLIDSPSYPVVDTPDTFAFIIHPIDPKKDVSRKWPWVGKLLTSGQIDFLSAYFPPVYMSEIVGVRSESTGRECRGWFIACPFTPTRMLQLPVNQVYDKIVACGLKGEALGARIVGLGAYTSVIGDSDQTIADFERNVRSDLSRTSG